MNVVAVGKYEWQTASNYNELSAKQLLSVCKLLLIKQHAIPIVTEEMIRQRIISVLFNIKNPILFLSPKNKVFLDMPGSGKAIIMYDAAVTNWVFEKAVLTEYKIQSFNYKGVRYYGPHDGILDITVGEFIEAIMYFSAYAEKPKDDLLNKLIAVLYRPGKAFYTFRKFSQSFVPDRRVANNSFHFISRASKFNHLPAELKMAIFLQFEGAFTAFSKNFKKCFSKKGKGQNSANWISLLMSMSNDIFGDYAATQKVDCFTFFTKVEQNIIQMDAQKK